MSEYRVLHGDCREVMATLDADSVDAVVCDPPYGLSFMGREWDHGVPGVPFWTEALRVAKPGAYLVAFGGTRTYHRLTVAIEDAGWEIRDCLSWLYGSGFPKSLDVGKAIDGAAGAERAITGTREVTRDFRDVGRKSVKQHGIDKIAPGTISQGATISVTAPATDNAKQWDGWGTALKPAWEPIILARKPFKQTVAANVQEHGTGALNIDGCRIGTTESLARPFGSGGISAQQLNAIPRGTVTGVGLTGRWPANVVFTHHEDCVEVGTRKVRSGNSTPGVVHGTGTGSTFLPTKESGRHYADADGTEMMPAFDCHTECPVRLLDEQSGERRSAGKYVKGNGKQGDKAGAASIPIDGLTSATYR